MSKVSLEIIKRVWLELRPANPSSKEYFGNINLPMTAEFALKLGEALISVAKEKL